MNRLPTGTDIESCIKLGYTKFTRFSAVEQAVALALEK